MISNVLESPFYNAYEIKKGDTLYQISNYHINLKRYYFTEDRGYNSQQNKKLGAPV